jgi:hypothetical protein
MEKKGGDIKDAEKAFKSGEKSLKTGLFKWSANHLEASMYFEKAAKLFQQLGEK